MQKWLEKYGKFIIHPEHIEAMLREKGYYDPLSVKWAKMMGALLRFDFGYSLQYGIPVTTLILLRLPNTLTLHKQGFING